jgi:signal transduction histidine kinase
VKETQRVSLSSIAEQCWSMVETGEADLVIESDRTFMADPDRLQRLFENLFRNAIEHAGPEVTVTVGALSDPPGFFVADDGPGIPEEKRDEVFESGYSTGESGTGFGLAIVQEIADAHGWRLSVTESADQGARFEITVVESSE